MAAGGITTEQAGEGPGGAIYAVPLIGSLLSAIAIGMLAAATGTDTLGEGLVLGVVMAIGFALSIAMGHGDVRIYEAESDALGGCERRLPHRGEPGRRRDHRRVVVGRSHHDGLIEA